MSEESFRVLRRWFEGVWNDRDGSVIDELLNEDSYCDADGDRIVGPVDFRKRMFEPLTAAFPDLFVRIDSMEDVDGAVLVRWSAEGTHCGEGLGCPPSNRKVSFRGWSKTVVRDGKLIRAEQKSDIPERLKEVMS